MSATKAPPGWRVRAPTLTPAATVVAALLLAGAACAIDLGSRSLWLDEGSTVAITSQHGAALWQGIAHDGGNMLVYYLLMHLVIGAFGDASWVIRLPSLIAQALTSGIVAALGLRLFGRHRHAREAAVAAALLTLVSLPLVFWGQDARGYALMVTLGCASWWALVAVVGAPAGAPTTRRRLALLGYGASVLLALYVGFDAVLLVPAQLAYVASGPRERAHLRRIVGVLAVVALLCTPLVVLALERGSGQLFWVPAPGASVLWQALVTLTSAGLAPNFHVSAVTLVAAPLTVLAVAAALVLMWRRGEQLRSATRLLACWLIIPAVLAVAAALYGEPIELARTSILLIPAISLLLASTLTRPGVEGRAAQLGVLVLLALRLAVLIPSYGVSPENWKAATRYVLAASRPAACVLFYPQDGRESFDYYVLADGGAAKLTPVYPSLPFSRIRPFVESYHVPSRSALRSIVASCPELWFVASHQGQAGGPAVSRRDFRRYRGLLGSLQADYPRSETRTFGYAAQVRVERFSREARRAETP